MLIHWLIYHIVRQQLFKNVTIPLGGLLADEQGPPRLPWMMPGYLRLSKVQSCCPLDLRPSINWWTRTLNLGHVLVDDPGLSTALLDVMKMNVLLISFTLHD